jgi:hypothetical protein
MKHSQGKLENIQLSHPDTDSRNKGQYKHMS